MLTPQQLDHIPDDQIHKDIKDTQREIDEFNARISDRQLFITELQIILAYREEEKS